MSDKIDDRVRVLFDKVEQKRKQIKSIKGKPHFTTNNVFTWFTGGAPAGAPVNLNVQTIESLLEIYSFLIDKEQSFQKTLAKLAAKGIELDVKFSHGGYSLEDWLKDIELHLSLKNIKKEEDKLKAMEAKLENLISPEMRRQLEIESLEKELA